MRADVCNCLFSIPRVWCQTSWHSCTLSPALLKSAHWCQWTRGMCVCVRACVSAYVYVCVGSISRVPLCVSHRDWVQKSQPCAFEESGGQWRLTSEIQRRWARFWLKSEAEVLQRAVQAGTGSAPARLSLGPTVDKTPSVKECWERCKKRVYNSARSRTGRQITISKIKSSVIWRRWPLVQREGANKILIMVIEEKQHN